MELFKSRAGLQITHVPYKGAAPAVNDLAGGHVDTMFCDLGTILPLHRPTASASSPPPPPNASRSFPTSQPSTRTPLTGFNSATFFALMAPPNTPRAIRDKLNKAIVAGMGTAEVQAKYKSIYIETSDLDAGAVADYIKAEAKLWGGVIRAAKITVEQ